MQNHINSSYTQWQFPRLDFVNPPPYHFAFCLMTKSSLTSNTRIVKLSWCFLLRKTEAHRGRGKISQFVSQFTPSASQTPLLTISLLHPHFVRTAQILSCRFPSTSLRTAAVGSLSPFGLASLGFRRGLRFAPHSFDFVNSRLAGGGLGSKIMLVWLLWDKAEN